MRAACEGGVEDDTVTLFELRFSRGQQAIVGLLRHSRRVEALAGGCAAAFVEREACQLFAHVVGRVNLPAQLATQRVGEGALPRGDAAHDHERERLRTGDGILQRKPEVAARSFRGRAAFLLRRSGSDAVQALDLAAHIGAVAFVEVHQERHPVVVQRGRHLGGEVARQIGAALVIQIHREESRIVGHVHVAEAIVELDAVVDVDCARRDVNVFKVQVAVAVADALLPDARREEFPVARVEPVGEEADGVKGREGEGVSDELPGLAEVFVGADAQPVDAAPCLNIFGWMLGLVELLEDVRDPVQVSRHDSIALDELVEKVTVGKLPHLHGVFHHLIAFAENEPAVECRDGHDAKVDSGAKAAVEGDLAFAEVAALLQRGEIEEAEVDRLLHLVNKGRRDKDERGMRLHQAHGARLVRIRVRVDQEGKQLLLRGGRVR